MSGKINYKVPFYTQKKWVCYLNRIKNNGVELAFARGWQLSNDQNLLDRKNRKYVAGINLYDPGEIPEKQIDQIVQEALLLDEMVSD
ncbi:MAG: DUF1801 domain-containing protein [Cyclobacteriaceae bacterium]